MKLPLSTGTLFSRSTRIPRTVRLTPSCQLLTPQIQVIQARTYALPFGMEAVKQTIAQNFGGDASHKIVSEDQQFALDQTPNLEGKVAIVTGGSQGIGYGCTHTMLSKGVKKLFILSMTKEVVDGATNAIKEEMGQEVADRVTWLHCDLSDWHQVTEVADKIAKSTDRIDILINNAGRGIMTYQLTSYGIDRHVCWSWNTRSLLHQTDRVPDGPKPHWPCHPHQPSPTNPEEDHRERQHRPHCQYSLECPPGLTIRYEVRVCARIKSRSRTQWPVWKIEACWHPLLPIPPKILVNAIHPGFVQTKMSTEDIHEPFPLGGYAMSVGMVPFKKDQFQGAVSTMFAATKTEKSGQYICPPAVPESGSDLSQNMELAEQLMKLTVEIVKEKTYSDSVAKGCPFKTY